MKNRARKVLIGFGLGMAIASLGAFLYGMTESKQVEALEPSQTPQTAIAPKLITDPKEITTNRDGFIPKRLRQSENPYPVRGIIGEDNRQPMTSRDYPWSTVGRIDVNYEPFCTGTLIYESLVLTNSHCVFENGKLAKNIHFYPNLINGRLRNDEDRATVKFVYAGTNESAVNKQDDWAILLLDKPLGKKYGFLSWKSLPLEVLKKNVKQVWLVGYSGDFPEPKLHPDLNAGKGETAGVHSDCSIVGESDGMLVHDCDTTGGASGSALITKIDGSYHIVGLHARRNKDNTENYAVEIERVNAGLATLK